MSIKLSEKAETRLQDFIKKYPDKRSATMAGLYIALEEFGCLDERAVTWISQRLEVSPVHIQEVVSFYTMYHSKPVGKYHVQICRTLSCAVRGAKQLTECVRQRFKTEPKEVTANGLWSYEEVECLGSCGTAPMCQINAFFFENLDKDKFNALLDRIERELPNLSYSTIEDKLDEGLKDYPKSQII